MWEALAEIAGAAHVQAMGSGVAQRRGAPEFSGEMIGWVLSGFSWVLSGFSWVLMGSHGYSWVLSGYSWVLMGSQWVLRLCIFGFSGGSQAGTPSLRGAPDEHDAAVLLQNTGLGAEEIDWKMR